MQCLHAARATCIYKCQYDRILMYVHEVVEGEMANNAITSNAKSNTVSV